MSFWNWLTGTASQEEQQAQLAAKQSQFVDALARRQAVGDMSQDEIQAAQQYVNSVQLDDVDAAAASGFREGLATGWENVLQAPGKGLGFVGGSLGTALKAVPAWFWLILAVGVFLWFGGARVLRRAAG